MPQSLAVFDAALKEDYSVGLRESINNSSVVLKHATRNEKDIVGREAVWSLHHSRSASTGSRAELGTLPAADAQRYEDPRETLKYMYHTLKVSGPALELTKNDRGAFARALKSETDGADKDLRNHACRQVIAGRYTVEDATPTIGRSGVLAVCGVTGASTTVVLATTTTNGEMRFFFVNQRVDIIDSTDGSALASSRTITAIDRANKTITISGAAVTTTSDHIVVVQGNYNTEFVGLPALLNDAVGDKVNGTDTVLVHRLSSATVPTWAAVKVGSSSTPISEDIIEQAFDAIETEGSGDSTSANLVVGGFEQRRTLSNKLQAQKRYDGKMTPVAGWRGLQLERGVYVAERYALDNDLFVISPKEISWFVGLDFTFDKVDGKVLFKALDGSDAYEARMKAYVALAATNRNDHARVQLQAV